MNVINIERERAWLRDCDGKRLEEIDHYHLYKLIHAALNELECARGDRDTEREQAAYWQERAQAYSAQLEEITREAIRGSDRGAFHPLYPERESID